jgi:cyclin D1/2/4, plant
VRHLLDVKTIERMEIFVLGSLNWRTNAVSPFSYISNFADKFNEGYPLTNKRISRCTELILGTLKGICWISS